MGNQLTDNLHPKLDKFMMDVAQGVFGDTKLTYDDIINFSKKATGDDINHLEEFFWDWTSQLTEEDEIDVDELEQHIYEVIKGV